MPLFLNDGIVQLEVPRPSKGTTCPARWWSAASCARARDLNLPGIDLGISAFTERDREWLKFALDTGWTR